MVTMYYYWVDEFLIRSVVMRLYVFLDRIILKQFNLYDDFYFVYDLTVVVYSIFSSHKKYSYYFVII